MKFDRSNKFDLCYYVQVNARQIYRVQLLNGQVNTFGANIYFADNGTSTSCKNAMLFNIYFL